MAERPCNGLELAVFHDLYARGVRLFHVDATSTEDIFHPELRAWHAPDQFDYSFQEKYWQRMLAPCPEAQLCLRMYFGSPPWWDAANPDELQQYADGRLDHSFQRSERTRLPSLASEKWRRDAIGATNHFLKWLDDSGWSKRVWGLFVCYGITWEWGILGSDDYLDYSRPMRERFRRWLRERYADVDALRDAWGDRAVTFESAAIPSKADRIRCDGELRAFPRDRASYDFQSCLNDVNAEHLIELSRPIRAYAGDRYKIGTFYGYTLTAREHNEFTGRYGAGGLHGGHHALKAVLDSKLFDFIASPYAYVNRDLGSGLLIQHFPLASVRHHGVGAYDESDLSTFKTAAFDVGSISRGYTATLEHSLLHQRLAFTQAMCRGMHWWWTELTGWVGPYAENYGDPALLAEIGAQVRWFERYAEPEARSAAEIALIIDERSIAALGLSSKLFMREIYQQLPAWAWCGAPFDCWLSSDVSRETMKPYKLAYVFAPYLDDDGRCRLHEGLCHSDRTVWWAPLTGSLTDRGTSAEAFSALTGFDDPQKFAANPKPMNGWTSLYTPAAALSAAELSNIARRAGVHLYAPPPIQVLASERFVGVHVRGAGAYTLAMPPGTWREVFSGQVLRENTWTFEALGVALFRRESAA